MALRTDCTAHAHRSTHASPPPGPAGNQLGRPRHPLTVTDDLGRQVTLTAEPRRIVALLPSRTEMLFAIGADEQLIAVDKYG